MTSARWTALVVLLLVAALLAVMLGTVWLTPAAVVDGLRGVGDPLAVTIVRSLRLPRAALAALVGAGLGVAGAALQGTLRNPLAEPYLLGVSGGAAVGAVTAIGLRVLPVLVPPFAFGGALLAVLTAVSVARAAGGRGDSRVLLMAGVVVGAFANAAIMILLANADANLVRGALWWMMGSAADATWTGVRWLALALVAGGAVVYALAPRVDVLALGEDAAAALGVEVERSSFAVFLAASFLAAATVAAAGLVGFVGLVVPHIARACGARAHRVLLLAAALFGAALLLAADLAARTIRAPVELPLGAVTALVGVPFFLWRLRSAR